MYVCMYIIYIYMYIYKNNTNLKTELQKILPQPFPFLCKVIFSKKEACGISGLL